MSKADPSAPIRMRRDDLVNSLKLVESSYLEAIFQVSKDAHLLLEIREKAQDLMVEKANKIPSRND